MQKLFDHQIKFLSQNPNKTVLVWSCGTSKTRTALEWSKLYKGTTLAVTPKSLCVNWKREMEKWGIKIDVMSKETFRKLHKGLKRYDQIICDEIHVGFLTPHFGSQMSKSLKWYLKEHKVERFCGCTATPFTSSPWNVFNLAHYIGHNWNWYKFKQEFFYDVYMGNRLVPMVKKGIEPKLAELTKKIASVVDIHDCMDVPEQLHCDPEYFALSKEQERAIKDNYDPVPIVRFTHQHEIENGILIGNEFKEAQFYETDKIERIKTLCEENKKIAIVCRYNVQIARLSNALNTYIKKKVVIIGGKTPNRDALCLEAERAEEAIVIIQADCGIGFQLPSFELCVYVSMSYSYTSWEQMNGRFLRMDKPSRTTFMYLLTEGESIDQAVYDAVKRREDFRIELYKKT